MDTSKQECRLLVRMIAFKDNHFIAKYHMKLFGDPTKFSEYECRKAIEGYCENIYNIYKTKGYNIQHAVTGFLIFVDPNTPFVVDMTENPFGTQEEQNQIEKYLDKMYKLS